MALGPDDEICFCFHVTLRKVENYCRIEKPKVASQISQCLSAGTGCGWCRPMLRKIHQRVCNAEEPWWRKIKDEGEAAEYHSAERDADPAQLDTDAYATGRQKYLKDTGNKPPADDAPLT
jgi:NAD(P)H-nitrite reductase large subunit